MANRTTINRSVWVSSIAGVLVLLEQLLCEAEGRDLEPSELSELFRALSVAPPKPSSGGGLLGGLPFSLAVSLSPARLRQV